MVQLFNIFKLYIFLVIYSLTAILGLYLLNPRGGIIWGGISGILFGVVAVVLTVVTTEIVDNYA